MCSRLLDSIEMLSLLKSKIISVAECTWQSDGIRQHKLFATCVVNTLDWMMFACSCVRYSFFSFKTASIDLIVALQFDIIFYFHVAKV